jgi:hypothetical protein
MVFIDQTVGSKIKTPDVGIPLVHTECKLIATKYNSLAK